MSKAHTHVWRNSKRTPLYKFCNCGDALKKPAPPQETGIDILDDLELATLAIYNETTNPSVFTVVSKRNIDNAAQALLRLFEKEAVEIDGYMLVKAVATGETINVPITGKAVALSKLRELLGGDKT